VESLSGSFQRQPINIQLPEWLDGIQDDLGDPNASIEADLDH
jgi:hypothetical protein